MACRGFLGCILKLLNFLLTLAGLAMVGYGIYLFVEYKRSSSGTVGYSPIGAEEGLVQLGRPLLVTVSLSASILDSLPKAWFIFLFIGVGVVLVIISCFGCIGTVTRNGCCLTCYSVLVILLILVELGCAAFIYFDKSWEDDVPTDKTGDFDMIYDFLKEHWTIVRWVALGVVLLEALVFLLTLIVRAANRPAEYDSDDEYVASRQQTRQPLLSRPLPPPQPGAGVPVAGALDQRPSRTDAWSTRMREKYGLDTAEFTYNPTESNRYQQVPTQPTEERSRCSIM
ncbi:tobamovirus multiplication protein 2A-like [Rhodamnia argentea]|uniref:Tobamovirus multiplication protein 2A-like n=1 Tax=Rhodamnia argentea TaxID=178133 RepID=A0A8B8NQZ2_9MYRT|nr:tobamovirus multiplication protein 2A-like [Rhodamnia argentea]XP_048140862.1 tobamovirus multiplication protein 2A-like [Rhodamnia argentea]